MIYLFYLQSKNKFIYSLSTKLTDMNIFKERKICNKSKYEEERILAEISIRK